MRTRHLILVPGLLVACGEAPSAPLATPPAVDAESQLTLFYSSRLDGEIEPCG